MSIKFTLPPDAVGANIYGVRRNVKFPAWCDLLRRWLPKSDFVRRLTIGFASQGDYFYKVAYVNAVGETVAEDAPKENP